MGKTWLVCCTILLLACTPLMRGFDGTTLVSNARPTLSINVDMPLLVSGKVTPYLYTAYGYQFPVTYIAVYGVDVMSPMAISVLSIAPDNWEWDPLSFTLADGPITSKVFFDGEMFEGSTRVIHGKKDPFTNLIASEGQFDSISWIAQRYSYRFLFNKAKIILEYREPLSKVFANSEPISMESSKVKNFQKRAQAVFQVSFKYKELSKPLAPYIKSINVKVLGDYLGNMSLVEPMMFNKN